ncbi:unnamed protein product [Pleuronectes platessa]|uniref:Uncharacterized protein n=1 Tax=Pleuronectes platessa TaxID=8262 RepID=A0A9N7TJY9_PLEPL|nr:unnamed protein product [Pleuronectes platessa]
MTTSLGVAGGHIAMATKGVGNRCKLGGWTIILPCSIYMQCIHIPWGDAEETSLVITGHSPYTDDNSRLSPRNQPQGSVVAPCHPTSSSPMVTTATPFSTLTPPN